MSSPKRPRRSGPSQAESDAITYDLMTMPYMHAGEPPPKKKPNRKPMTQAESDAIAADLRMLPYSQSTKLLDQVKDRLRAAKKESKN